MGTTGQSITLANSIIGVGILAMPFCFQQCGVLLATIILIFMGLVSRLCCYYLLKSAVIARRRNFEFLAFHVFGSAGKLGVEIGIIGFLMGTCIAYFVVVGDLGPQIISKMFNINQSDMLRTSIMVIVSLVCVLPLGLLRNVDSLSNVSAATIGFYFCLVLKVIAEAASQLLTDDWQTRVELWKPSGVLQCVPIFSMALFCQTQLFEIFESLPGLSMEKMNKVTKNAINICTGVYFTLGLFGYIAFNSQEISGNILMSLSPTMASDVIKLGFVMSLAFSFPLIIFPCRASLYSLLYKKVHSSHHDHIINQSIPESSFRCITVCIIALTLGVSLLLPNIELVLGLVGSTIGVLVCLVFPAAAFLSLTYKDTNERLLAKAIVVLGLIIMFLGTYANLQAAEKQADKYDDKITKERIDKMVEDFFEHQDKPEGVINKPEVNGVHVEKEKNNGESKESVPLPPNPVPPESQSNEKNENNGAVINNEINMNAEKPETKDNVDKVSESHPKNLNKLTDIKAANGKKDEIPKEEVKPQSNDEKINMIKQQQLIETIKQHGKEQKELIKEQKEILNELKKTKQELQKNKNEVADANAQKIAVESIKKIANIALQSLGGVSEKPSQGVDEKPKTGEIGKLADKTVQEIAQKAVETIQAIKETKDKPAQLNSNSINPPDAPVLKKDQASNVASEIKSNNVPVHNNNFQNNVMNSESLKTNDNINNQENNVNQNIQNNVKPHESQQSNNIPASNNVQSNVESASNIGAASNNIIPQNVGQPTEKNSGTFTNNALNLPNNDQLVNNINLPNHQAEIKIDDMPVMQPVNPEDKKSFDIQPDANNVQMQPQGGLNYIVGGQNGPNAIPNQTIQKDVQNQLELKNIDIKEAVANMHSHSPDEPQSYKQDEDSQKKNDVPLNNAAAQNIPLPLAINNNNNENVQNSVPNINALPNNVDNSKIVNNVDNNKREQLAAPVRQKREVVDCTDKSALKPEDKEICNTLVDNPKSELYVPDVKDILSSNVDLTQVNLPNNLPLGVNIIHHISRSLKTFEENEKNVR